LILGNYASPGDRPSHDATEPENSQHTYGTATADLAAPIPGDDLRETVTLLVAHVISWRNAGSLETVYNDTGALLRSPCGHRYTEREDR
jgi:hypothetical protein